MAHEPAVALQQAGRIRQRCAVKEPNVDVRGEYIDVAEGRISQTCNRTAVMQKLPDFVAALSHHLKPLMRDCSQFTCMLFHPRIDSGIPLDSAVESQQFRRLHRFQLSSKRIASDPALASSHTSLAQCPNRKTAHNPRRRKLAKKNRTCCTALARAASRRIRSARK